MNLEQSSLASASFHSLFQHVWPLEEAVEEDTVKVHLRGLRPTSITINPDD
jgi:DNA-binding response OmpR family regulator